MAIEYTLPNILKMYRMYMNTGTTGLLPHGFGPPGVGKSHIAQQAADLLGVNLHVINVARISPLEVEGIQMPVDNNQRLLALTATFWTRIQPGDIVLWDEYLRGFPEVYNSILDIMTSRVVGDFKIPQSFWIAASNSIATYDPALEDRLLHMPVPDIRNNKTARDHSKKIFVEETGMHPGMVDSYELEELFEVEVDPMYSILDDLANKRAVQHTNGSSVRNLISQVHLRQFKSRALKDVIKANNQRAVSEPEWQVMVSPQDKEVFSNLLKSDRLTPMQRMNAQIHLELAEMVEVFREEARKEEEDEDDIFT